MKKYRVGIVGPGTFAQFCMRQYQKMPEVEIATVVGRDEERTKGVAKKFAIPEYTTDYNSVLNDKDIDLVAIFTPPYVHANLAVAAARARKPFLCEKPLAISIAQADEIIGEAKHNEVPAIINYVMRYSPLYEKVKAITQSGKFGRLDRMIFENYAASDKLAPNHWLWDESKSGGLLVEHGVHFFDIFSHIVGKMATRAMGHRPYPNEEFAAVKYDNIFATYYHVFNKPKGLERNYARFIFERGYADIDGWIPLSLRTEWEDSNGQIQLAEEKISESKTEHYGRLIQEVLRDLISSIEDPSHRQKVTLEDGRSSLETAIMAKNHPMF